jgi:hypothetical protein
MISSKKWFSTANPTPLFNFLKLERRLTLRKDMLFRSAAISLLEGKKDAEEDRSVIALKAIKNAFVQIANGEDRVETLNSVREEIFQNLVPKTKKRVPHNTVIFMRQIEHLTATDDSLHFFRTEIIHEYSRRYPQYGTQYIRVNELLTNIIRDLFQNVESSFDESWKTTALVEMAEGMLRTGDFSAMWAIADLLQESGCEDSAILNHCRDASQLHYPGCWVVDLILGKK